MTVKELIEKLSKFDDRLEVEILEPYDKAAWIDVSSVKEEVRSRYFKDIKVVRIS